MANSSITYAKLQFDKFSVDDLIVKPLPFILSYTAEIRFLVEALAPHLAYYEQAGIHELDEVKLVQTYLGGLEDGLRNTFSLACDEVKQVREHVTNILDQMKMTKVVLNSEKKETIQNILPKLVKSIEESTVGCITLSKETAAKFRGFIDQVIDAETACRELKVHNRKLLTDKEAASHLSVLQARQKITKQHEDATKKLEKEKKEDAEAARSTLREDLAALPYKIEKFAAYAAATISLVYVMSLVEIKGVTFSTPGDIVHNLYSSEIEKYEKDQVKNTEAEEADEEAQEDTKKAEADNTAVLMEIAVAEAENSVPIEEEIVRKTTIELLRRGLNTTSELRDKLIISKVFFDHVNSIISIAMSSLVADFLMIPKLIAEGKLDASDPSILGLITETSKKAKETCSLVLVLSSVIHQFSQFALTEKKWTAMFSIDPETSTETAVNKRCVEESFKLQQLIKEELSQLEEFDE